MPKRTRAGALLSLATAGLALGTALAAPANAATTTPGFLAARDLPPHPSSSWTADKVAVGVPEDTEWDTCLLALPGHEWAWHRDFRTDLDTNARQITVVLPDVRSAKYLIAALDRDITSCPERIEGADPETEATVKDYGKLAVEEGAHVYGLHTETSWGASDVRLLSAGRDGRAVTVVNWGQMGGFEGAPVKAFKKTTVTAVNKLH
ncbi:hypothetical protein ACIBL8_39800 [Streptomyces sp. NPDC050523]|uniref:hypothetical protein n=1 Tax=Streptomyces sp. NPDC050523 TaxID=3365622 RepID=UPI003798A79B